DGLRAVDRDGIGAATFEDVKGDHRPETANMADREKIAALGELMKTARNPLADRVGASEKPFLLDNVENRKARGASERESAVGSAKPARLDRVHDFGAADHARDRQSAAHRL